MKLVCVDKSFERYTYIKMSDLSVVYKYDLVDTSFNEKSYLKLLKDLNKMGSKNKSIYTVIAEITNDYDGKYTEGYLIASNKCSIELIKESELLNFVKRHIVTNFYLVSGSTGEYVRKKVGVDLFKMNNSELKKIYPYSLDDYRLNKDMNLDQLEFCMQKNGFKLGYSEDFKAHVYGKGLEDCKFLIYYNKKGDILYFNYTETGKLGYFGNELLALRHVNSNKYHKYLKNNPYLSCSSHPFGDIDISDIILFSYSDIYRFMQAVKGLNEYSTPVLPLGFSCKSESELEKSSSLFCLFYLRVNPEERIKIDEKIKKLDIDNKEIERQLSLIAQFLYGMLRCRKFTGDLAKIFSNMEKYYMYAYNDCIEDIKAEVDKLNMIKRKGLKDKISRFLEEI